MVMVEGGEEGEESKMLKIGKTTKAFVGSFSNFVKFEIFKLTFDPQTSIFPRN